MDARPVAIIDCIESMLFELDLSIGLAILFGFQV